MGAGCLEAGDVDARFLDPVGIVAVVPVEHGGGDEGLPDLAGAGQWMAGQVEDGGAGHVRGGEGGSRQPPVGRPVVGERPRQGGEHAYAGSDEVDVGPVVGEGGEAVVVLVGAAL